MSKPSLGKGLGKGLGALLEPNANSTHDPKTGILEVDINKINPNKSQPRKYFDTELLEELADSIKSYGIVQPIVVKDEGDFYTIVAGERRWRAARLAKIKTVPVVIKDYSDMEVLQIALIENIQREDLNPIEEALCYKRLMEDYLFDQKDIAEKVGKNRNVISGYLMLLKLDDRVQTLIMEGRLPWGHGKALLTLEDGDVQYSFADKIADSGLGIKQGVAMIEKYIADMEKEVEEQEEVPPTYKDVEKELNTLFSTKVKIKNNHKTNKGKIEIDYYSPEELDRLLLMFKKI